MKIRYTYSGGGMFKPDLESIADKIGPDATDFQISCALYDDFELWIDNGGDVEPVDRDLIGVDLAAVRVAIAKIRAARGES